MYWEYGRNASYLRPAEPKDRSPVLAIREGDWKLLMNAAGSDLQLYNLAKSLDESMNVASSHPEIAQSLKDKLLEWKQQLPNYPTTSDEGSNGQ